MKKSSTVTAAINKNFRTEADHRPGLDLGDRSSWYCVLGEAGEAHERAETGHDSEGDERKSSWRCRAAG